MEPSNGSGVAQGRRSGDRGGLIREQREELWPVLSESWEEEEGAQKPSIAQISHTSGASVTGTFL